MIKKILITLLAMVLTFGALAGIKVMQIMAMIEGGKNAPAMTESVSTATVEEAVWEETLNAVGSVKATQGVTVSAEVPGVVSTIAFESGENVEKGDPLIELDATTEQAQLSAADAKRKLAQLRFDRAKQLREKDTIAQSELDSAEAELLEAQAQVANLTAVIEKKRIVAPFSGRLGIRQVDIGQFLNVGSPVVSLQHLGSVYVDFTQPQNVIESIGEGMPVRLKVDSFPNEAFEGEVSAIAPSLNEATRTVSVRATLDNPNRTLRPGMFGEVEVILPDTQPTLVIPTTSILYAPYGNSVYVVEETDEGPVAKQAFVRTGRQRGDFISVEEGLNAGDTVVSSGVFKLRNGMGIVINNDLAPKAALEPELEDA